MPDRITDTMVDGLKRALAGGDEHRLFKAAKLEGLFPARTGVHGEAANRALRDGLLEVIRTEEKGKTHIDWVRLTPAGNEFLATHESPARVLEELRESLQLTRQGIPLWLTQLQQQWSDLGKMLVQSVEDLSKKIDAVNARIDAVLSDVPAPAAPPAHATNGDWTRQVLEYLDRRRKDGQTDECPLSEVYHAVAPALGELSLKQFHDGLRKLRDDGSIQLAEHAGTPDELPEPEYALVDGASVYCHVAR